MPQTCAAICDLLGCPGWKSFDSADTHADKGTGPDIMSVCLCAGVCVCVCEQHVEKPLALSAEHSMMGAAGECISLCGTGGFERNC